MDGIAVRAADTIGASESTPVLLEPGAYVVVDTGDPLPDGFDAVVMREHVHYDGASRAELRGAAAPYQHVRSIGEDVSATELLLPAGHRLRPVDVAAAAAAGATDVLVRRRPVVAVIPTGDEIRPVGTPTGARRDPRHELADARRRRRRRPAARRGAPRSSPTTPSGSPPRCATPPRGPTS